MKFKKIIIFFLSTFLFLSLFTTISQAEEIKIICTNSALADFTSNIIKENASIEYIMPPGVCPAFYDTTPSDIDKIISADIVISLGSVQMESWLGNLLTYNSDVLLIECKNLGEWNIPTGAINYVNTLSEKLAGALPELNESISENSQNYILQINEKAQELKKLIDENETAGKALICMQWQEDFLNYFDLNIVYSYGSPQGLSVQDQLDVINAASTNKVYVVIDNLQSGTDFGAKVASESGASHVIFTNFPGAIPGTDTYLQMITYNTKQLINGIASYEYKQGDISKLKSQISDLELQRNLILVLTLILGILTIAVFLMYKRK